MVLKLYGCLHSTCTRLVALICKEKEIPYELIPIDLSKREQKNPNSSIDDDRFILYESRAIAHYLINNQGTLGLIPTDPKEEALFEQAASVEAFHFHSQAAPFVFEKVLEFVGKSDPVKVNEYREKLGEKLDVYDVILGEQKYLTGNNLTLADLQHLTYGGMLSYVGHGDVIAKRPNVARWLNDIINRPSWQAVKDGA